MRTKQTVLTLVMLVAGWLGAAAWPGMPMPVLKVEGRYLVDADGNRVNLHGFGQTYSPWFNEQGSKWSNYDVNACLNYNKGIIDQIVNAGWKVDWVRMHMDPYWSNKPGVQTTGENDISAFDFDRFRQYLDAVFLPMAEYAISKGLYVVMRPPGVCPHQIAVGDAYHKYLKQVWGYTTSLARIKNNPHIMLELANEPVDIKGDNGQYAASGDSQFRNLTQFFQEIVDIIRGQGCNNILWVPGTGYQSQYQGFAKYPIQGSNIGYAVHVYPGWYGSDAIEPSQELGGSFGGGYDAFRNGWEAQIKPCAAIAPILVTEMDWAPTVYNASWGKSITGKLFEPGFGANFKDIADNTGNVSWMLFTGPEILGRFNGVAGQPGNYTVLNDPDACIWPAYHWYKEYAGDQMPAPQSVTFKTSIKPVSEGKYTLMTGGGMSVAMVADYGTYQNNLPVDFDVTITPSGIVSFENNRLYADAQGTATVTVKGHYGDLSVNETFTVESTLFPLVEGIFNPSIWETGTFDATTRTFTTGQYGFAGWQYGQGVDLSGYKYLVAKIKGNVGGGLSFRAFDKSSYWTSPAVASFDGRRAVIDLRNMRAEDGTVMDAHHIYIVGFWTYGGTPITLDKVYVTDSDNPDEESGLEETLVEIPATVDVYGIDGIRVRTGAEPSEATQGLRPGIYIINGQKILVK